MLKNVATEHPGEGLIYPTQDSDFIYDNLRTPFQDGEPLRGHDDGMKEEENLTWLMGGDGGTVAAHAVPDDPQTKEPNEDNPKSGESAVPAPMEPVGQGGGDGGAVAAVAAPLRLTL